jgi:hypothetical protein
LRGTFGDGCDGHCALAGAVSAARPITNKVVCRRIVMRYIAWCKING